MTYEEQRLKAVFLVREMQKEWFQAEGIPLLGTKYEEVIEGFVQFFEAGQELTADQCKAAAKKMAEWSQANGRRPSTRSFFYNLREVLGALKNTAEREARLEKYRLQQEKWRRESNLYGKPD